MKILRTIVAVMASYLLAYVFVPLFPTSISGTLILPVVIIFSIVFGIVTYIAVDRRERLKESVATELNKLRRVYHLGKNLGTSPYLRSWFTDLHGFIYDYLGGFEKYDLSEYEKGNALFRRIAYHVYVVPDLREVKEQVLYDELLAATAVVSDARQKIATLIKNEYARSHWFELVALFVIFVATVLMVGGTDQLSRFVTANILAGGTILALSFFEHDIWTKEGNGKLSMEYVKNIARLELRRG